MAGPIRTLADIRGGSVRAVCRQCGRVALFAAFELDVYFRARRWPVSWPAFAAKLRCNGDEGCGALNPEVSWVPQDPPKDPLPPRPRFARPGKLEPPEATNVIDFAQRRKRRA